MGRAVHACLASFAAALWTWHILERCCAPKICRLEYDQGTGLLRVLADLRLFAGASLRWQDVAHACALAGVSMC